MGGARIFDFLDATLRRAGGDVSEVAKRMGLTPRAVYMKLATTAWIAAAIGARHGTHQSPTALLQGRR